MEKGSQIGRRMGLPRDLCLWGTVRVLSVVYKCRGIVVKGGGDRVKR